MIRLSVRRFATVGVVFFVFSAWVLTQVASAAPRQIAKFGEWTVDFVPSERGQPAYCRAKRAYGNEYWLSIIAGKQYFAIDFMAQASFAAGDRYGVEYWVDDRPANGGTATFADKIADSEQVDWMRIDEGIEEIGTVDALMNGKVLYIRSAAENWIFPLDGSNPALKRLFECNDQLVSNVAPPQAAIAPPPPARQPARRQADCLMIVRGRTYINGRCGFDSDPDGSFRIFGDSYFAYVSVHGNGVADASWNADPKSTHAHAPLGELIRRGACWANNIARICAWKIGERPPEARWSPGRPMFSGPAPLPGRPAPPQPHPSPAAKLAGTVCPAPGFMRSKASQQAAQVQFANSTPVPLSVYWLDFNGQRKFYRLLAPGQNYVQPTFVGHPWILVDKKGRCHGGVFWPRAGKSINEVFN